MVSIIELFLDPIENKRIVEMRRKGKDQKSFVESNLITELTKWKELYSRGELPVTTKVKIDQYVDKYRKHPIYAEKVPYTMKDFWGEKG
jgi:hypothetical protein